MARPAPGVARTVAVLNFFAAHPEQAFTLTDILRSLGLNRATCHSLLAALVAEGYLYRDSAKAYRIGPALAALGGVAHRSFQPAVLARDEMRRLADELQLVCVGAARIGDELVILERASGAPAAGLELYPGRRFPMRPPAGLSFAAWSTRGEVEEWLASCDPAPDADETQVWRDTLARIREQGFCFGVGEPYGDRAASATGGGATPLQPDLDPGRRGRPPAPLPDMRASLRFVSAPVLDRAGAIIFSLALWGFQGSYTPDEIRAFGMRLREAANRVTRATGGKAPAAEPASRRAR
jgi:DNA-binding IclR family transcriptional regulator